jgi:Flp pilus assembly protein TadB
MSGASAAEASPVSARPPIREVPPAGSTAPEEIDDQSAEDRRGPGLSSIWLLAVFGLAALVVVGAVWLVGAVGQWWLLVPAMAVHLGMTALIVWLCFKLASDGELADDAQ